MKLKLLLGLALVLSGGLLCSRTVAQNLPKTNEWRGFQILPPINNAGPAILHQISAHVPARLKIERTVDTLSVGTDTNSFESTNLMVGTNMIMGVRSEWFVYPAGEPRPANGGEGLSGGLDFNLATSFWHTKPDGIPQAGKSYIVEIDLAAFETDIPPQHDWEPHGKNYKIIWQRTLKQIVK